MTHPSETTDSYGPDAELMHALVLHGARLAGAIRDVDPDTIHNLIHPDVVPGGRVDLLALALAAMVDPDRRPSELVAWSLPENSPALLTARERDAQRKRDARAARRETGPTLTSVGRPPAPREHGTAKGWGQHRTHGDPVCEPCRIAHRVEVRPAICREEFARLVAAGVPLADAADATTLSKVLAGRTARIAS